MEKITILYNIKHVWKRIYIFYCIVQNSRLYVQYNI